MCRDRRTGYIVSYITSDNVVRAYSRAGDDQWTSLGTAHKHTLVRSNRHHRTPEVVGVVVVRSVVVLDISIESLVADGASGVRNLVLRVDQVAARKTGVCSKVSSVVGSLTLDVGKFLELSA